MKLLFNRWVIAMSLLLFLSVGPYVWYNSIDVSLSTLAHQSKQVTQQLEFSDGRDVSPTPTPDREAVRTQNIEGYDARTEAEFRLTNIKRLMATPVTGLTSMQKQMIVQQILEELPFLVSSGELHPFDATLAHVKASAHQNTTLQEYEIDALRDEYIAMYPSDIRIQSHPAH